MKINNKNDDITSVMSKKIIWALFDDAESSYKNAIKLFYDGKYEVHSIGINDLSFGEENYKYHKIDLSITNFNLFKQLNKLPKPDIILASPPCESWSIADCNGRMFRGFDNYGKWIVKNKKHYDEYNKSAHPVKRRSFAQKEIGRIIGESTIGATIEIINHYKPKVWIIENPLTSKTWEFQKNHWCWDKKTFLNRTYYSAYDENFSKKPTIFKSNIKLSLSSEAVKGNKSHMARGSYSKRSSIPFALIKDMLDQVKKEVGGE